MSKRKSRTKSMFIDKTDIQFPDDSDDPDIELFSKPQMKNFGNEIKHSKATGSRISARGKKEKKIYDPSDHNGPVHKKKKEALEAATKKFNSPSKSPTKIVTPTKTPKASSFPAKTPEKASLQRAKRRLEIDDDVDLIQGKVRKIKSETLITPAVVAAPAVVVNVAPVKEPNNRIQGNNIIKENENQTKRIVTKPVKSILKSQSLSVSDSEDTASTVPVHENKNIKDKIREVSSWTANDVCKYFQSEGFDKKDAMKFEEEEIDGEALLILRRCELEKLNLKVGVCIKMWNRILCFQSGIILSSMNLIF